MAGNSTSTPVDTSKAVKDALFTGLMAFGLFVLLIGFKTDQNIRNELILLNRPILLGIFVVAAMAIRYFIDTVAKPYFAERRAEKAAVIVDVNAPQSFLRRNFSKIGLCCCSPIHSLFWRLSACRDR